MSMYEMACSHNPAAAWLLQELNLENPPPRWRDTWVNAELTEITVFTRTGGNNRPEYEAETAEMRYHPLFVAEDDWCVDTTYALFRFRINDITRAKINAEIAALPTDVRNVFMRVITDDATIKWNRALEALRK